MSESRHTPGPWQVVDGHYPGFREIIGPSFTISIVMLATDLTIHDRWNREADAQLIAAAPDLLAACEDALATCWNEMQYILDNGRLRDVLRAAIDKAKGGDQ